MFSICFKYAHVVNINIYILLYLHQCCIYVNYDLMSAESIVILESLSGRRGLVWLNP